jgi:hypothetical protein
MVQNRTLLAPSEPRLRDIQRCSQLYLPHPFRKPIERPWALRSPLAALLPPRFERVQDMDLKSVSRHNRYSLRRIRATEG